MPRRLTALASQRVLAEQSWSFCEGEYVPLALAAAVLFHRLHVNAKVQASSDDYEDALNIAAAALARVAPIYMSVTPC